MSDAAAHLAPLPEPQVEHFDMRANFEGLIQLLARNLYSEPDVFVRELIQNAHDSIRRRDMEEPGHQGRIEIEVDRDGSNIVFRDNGIGMDRTDIHEFLSVIGSTGTGATRARLEEMESDDALQLVGQFGIGMLSAFVVADRVTVTTRKLGSEQAFTWMNEGRTECLLSAAALGWPGSEIRVSVGREHTYMLDPQRIRDSIIRYCDFLPIPIHLDGRGPVNTVQAPWDRSGWASEEARDEAYRAFVSRRYPDVPLEVIPVELEEPVRARGALYISDRRVPDFNTAGVVDIFVRRMFVRGNDDGLLPPWAKFIRGVIECPDLQPTAARDNVQRSDWAFTALRQRIGDLIIGRLIELAEQRPHRFREINRWHHYHLKGMACVHDDFRDKVGGLLLYETNRGLMPLRDLFSANGPSHETEAREEPWRGDDSSPRLGPVYFFSDDGSQPQFYQMADARGWTVANAGHLFDQELLVRYARSRGDQGRLRRLDAGGGSVLFRPPPEEVAARASSLERNIDEALARADLGHVETRVGSFQPACLPSIVLLSPESEAELELEALVQQPWFMESLRDVAEEVLRRKERRPVQLHVNLEHPLVQSLLHQEQRPPSALVALLLCAAINARGLLTPHAVDRLHAQLVDLIGLALVCPPLGDAPWDQGARS